MKKLFIPFILLLIIAGCGGEEPEKLEVYNTEAFAYDIGDGTWEVNAHTRVKGFKQNENNNTFTASLSFEVDLVTPAGNIVSSLINKTEDKSNNERMMDADLEAQFELDSTYVPGKYNVVFRVRDILSEQADSSSASFEIEGEEEM
ncbi:MAG: hypothetical protein R6W90_12130 [Ignavibacteriaceae bacterium]